jgi:hypothetical protein
LTKSPNPYYITFLGATPYYLIYFGKSVVTFWMFLAEVVRVSVWIVGLAFVIGDHWFGFSSKKRKISRICVG